FVLVCAGVLVLQNKPNIPRGKFKTPYINAKYVFPLLIVIGAVYAFTYNKNSTLAFLNNEKQINTPEYIVTSLNTEEKQAVMQFLKVNDSENRYAELNDLERILSLSQSDETAYVNLVESLPVSENVKYESGFTLFKHKIPMYIFLVVLVFIGIWTWRENLSLIPVLGLTSCLYMMAELSVWNWIYFGCWLLIGLIIYFTYSRKHSKLNVQQI
ncbi:MAG: amino acid permease, partial [Pedobacter sp.]